MTGTGWVPLRSDLDKILGIQNTTCSETDGDVRHRAVLPATGSAPALPARSGHPFPGRPVRPWGAPISVARLKIFDFCKPILHNDLWRNCSEPGVFF
jgi:hypothetical protein